MYIMNIRHTTAISLISCIMSSASFRVIHPRSHHRAPVKSRGCIAVAKVTDVTPLPSLAFTLTWTVNAFATTLRNTSNIPILKLQI